MRGDANGIVLPLIAVVVAAILVAVGFTYLVLEQRSEKDRLAEVRVVGSPCRSALRQVGPLGVPLSVECSDQVDAQLLNLCVRYTRFREQDSRCELIFDRFRITNEQLTKLETALQKVGVR